MTFDITAIQQHIKSSISAAPLMTEPFPNLVIDDVFPEDFYKTYVEGIPPREKFRSFYPDQPREAQDVFILESAGYKSISAQNAARHMAMRECFTFISDLIMERFESFVPHVLEELFPTSWEERYRLVKRHHALPMQLEDRRSTCTQAAHTDRSHRITTWLLYMPLEGNARQMGTDFFKAVPKDPLNYNPLRTLFTCMPDDIELTYAGTPEFRPNRIVAFVNSPLAFHGYRSMRWENPPERRLSIKSHTEYDISCYPQVYKDVPEEYFDLDPDHHWKPLAKAG